MQAGEILVKQGKYDDAVNAYTKIKDKYFQSYQAISRAFSVPRCS